MKKRYHKSGQPQMSRGPSDRTAQDRPERSSQDRPQRSRPDARRQQDGRTHTTAPASSRLQGPLLWGLHAVRAAFLNPQRRILRLLVTEAGLASFEDTLDDAIKANIKRVQPEILDKVAYERLMPPGSVHQGVAALVEALPVRDAHDLIANLKDDEKATIVILDQVTDPHNVGAILRSASAFGATGVIMQDRHAPELSGVLAKTASGAADVIPVAVETNLSRTIEFLQERNFFVIGLDERGTSISELPSYDRVALVLGAEGSGLRRLVADHCDGLASLPTQGPILSLNVSNAAAVALYALGVRKA